MVEEIVINTGLTPEQEMELHKNKIVQFESRPTPQISLEVPIDSDYKVDLSNWKMRDYSKWIKTATSGDFEEMSMIMATVIDNQTFDSIQDLKPKEFMKAAKALTSAAGELFL